MQSCRILRGVLTLMLQDVATRIQQADKEQRGAEGKASKRANTKELSLQPLSALCLPAEGKVPKRVNTKQEDDLSLQTQHAGHV